MVDISTALKGFAVEQLEKPCGVLVILMLAGDCKVEITPIRVTMFDNIR
jgi:hypothetical protein